MTKDRASIFSPGDDFDISDFKAKPPSHRTAPSREAVAALSKAAGFNSREGDGSDKEPRQLWRTGRNAQLNLKATPETIAKMRQIGTDNGWPLAVTLERALDALDRELANLDR